MNGKPQYILGKAFCASNFLHIKSLKFNSVVNSEFSNEMKSFLVRQLCCKG